MTDIPAIRTQLKDRAVPLLDKLSLMRAILAARQSGADDPNSPNYRYRRTIQATMDAVFGAALDSATALPSSAELSTMDEARTYWRTHFGGKILSLTVHSGGKEFPIKVRFDAGNDHAYTDSQDDSGKKLSRRVFSLKRAQAMSRILPVIEYPKRRLRNHWGVLLLEGRRGSEHYTVVLTWRNTA